MAEWLKCGGLESLYDIWRTSDKCPNAKGKPSLPIFQSGQKRTETDPLGLSWGPKLVTVLFGGEAPIDYEGHSQLSGAFQ